MAPDGGEFLGWSSSPRILNMIIAIYSNEYGRLEMESDLLFQRDPRRRET